MAAGDVRLQSTIGPLARAGAGSPSMTSGSGLPGMRYEAIERFVDERGSFLDLWREDTFGPIDPAAAGEWLNEQPCFVQANLS